MTAFDQPVTRTAYQQSVADYWNAEKDPVNLRLGDVDGLYHHHYGLGDYDPAVLDAPGDRARPGDHRRDAPARDRAGRRPARPPRRRSAPGDRLLDAGCGRGGTSVMAHQRFGCQVDGISISEQQVGFANEHVRQRGIDG